MTRKILRDDQWYRIEQMLPGKAGNYGVTAKDNRLFVEAVLWIARTGSPWRDLPNGFGNWNSVYKRFARWSDDGVWHGVFAELCKDAGFGEGFYRYHDSQGAPKKRLPSAWAFTGRLEYQGSCRGGRVGLTSQMVPDRRRAGA